MNEYEKHRVAERSVMDVAHQILSDRSKSWDDATTWEITIVGGGCVVVTVHCEDGFSHGYSTYPPQTSIGDYIEELTKFLGEYVE